jgi:hypothetical protein
MGKACVSRLQTKLNTQKNKTRGGENGQEG